MSLARTRKVKCPSRVSDLNPIEGKATGEMKKMSTPRDLVVELKKARKHQGPLASGFQDWVMINDPLDVKVSKGSFARALEFIEKFATEMPGYGISFSPQKGDVQAVNKTLGTTFLGHWLPIEISEGYVGDKNSASYEGKGLLRIEIGENRRWDEAELLGDLASHIPSILEGIHQEGGQAFFQEFEDKKAAQKLERQRLAESELVHSHWVNKAVASQAEEQAQSWQLATLIREYSAALLGMAQDHPESTKWAQWLGKYADWIDPLAADLPAIPAIRGPFNWELGR
jgi:hypothetical protein